MDFDYTSEQQEFRREFREWLEDNLPNGWLEGNRILPSDDDSREAVLREWAARLHEGGWSGISWPEEYGGQNASLIKQVIFNQELARVNAPLMLNRVGVLYVGPTLIVVGTEEQKQRYLPKILSGDHIWCQGFSEPNAGSDLANIQTKAVREGDEFVIDGQKIWTSFAHYADWCFLLARTDESGRKHEGITALMVPMDQDGVTVEPIRQITDRSDFAQVFFDGAVTDTEHVVGEVDNGWEVAMTLLSFEHGLSELYQPDRLALNQRWEQLVEYCQTHQRDGKPLSENDQIRQELASLYARLQAAKITHLRYVQEQMESGEAGPKGSMDKVVSSELWKDLEDFAMKVQGREALLWDDGIDDGEWVYRYLRSFGSTISGGTSEIHRNIIAERVLGLPKDNTR